MASPAHSAHVITAPSLVNTFLSARSGPGIVVNNQNGFITNVFHRRILCFAGPKMQKMKSVGNA